MLKNQITTRGRQTVRWSTLPAENEMLSHDLLLVGNDTTDYSDLLLLECVKSLTKNQNKIKELELAFHTRTILFREQAKNMLKNLRPRIKSEGFKHYITDIHTYLWRNSNMRPIESLDALTNVFLGIGHVELSNVSERSTLSIKDIDDIRLELVKLTVPDELLQDLPDIVMKLRLWLDDPTYRDKKTMEREIVDNRLIWLNLYPTEELVLLSRVSNSLGRKELNLYQKLTIASNIVYGVSLSVLSVKHKQGILFEPRPVDKILSYPRYYNRNQKLEQICSVIRKLQG